jgi:hypothetical protein
MALCISDDAAFATNIHSQYHSPNVLIVAFDMLVFVPISAGMWLVERYEQISSNIVYWCIIQAD